jgi:hypothetical protein
MPQRAWNSKRERQYEHVKEGLEERGSPGERRKVPSALGTSGYRWRCHSCDEVLTSW